MANRVAKKPGKLLYLYGITDRKARVEAGEGVDGHAEVEAIPCASFFCWISRVNADEYGEKLQGHMESLDWLAAAGVRHQKVVGAIHEQTTILPARFATLFVSEESLAADLKRRSAQLKKDFLRLGGADEYGVKVFAVPRAMEAGEAPRSGRDYLARKSEILRDRAPVSASAEVEKFAAELRALASETGAGGSVTSGQRQLVWQGALLIPRARRKRLESVLAKFQSAQTGRYRAECTGPWPPYTFVAVKARANAR